MHLKYIGEPARQGSAVPLPEAWPAADHEEQDEAVARAKLKPVEMTRPAGADPDLPAPTSGPWYREMTAGELEAIGIAPPAVEPAAAAPRKATKPQSTDGGITDGDSA